VRKVRGHETIAAHAIILAGGRGTRFWPRSRTRTPKQLLNIIGRDTMLEQTAARLAPLFPPSRQWVVTNSEQAAAVRKQMPHVPATHILAEPTGRNTAAAIGLAAAHLLHMGMGKKNDALMAVLPADHYIAKPARYLRIVRAALHVAHAAGSLVVLGIPPSRPETGFGYIERARGKSVDAEGDDHVFDTWVDPRAEAVGDGTDGAAGAIPNSLFCLFGRTTKRPFGMNHEGAGGWYVAKEYR